MLGEQHLCYKFGVKSVIANKIDYFFNDINDIKNILKNADIVFGNLEAAISSYTINKGFESNFFLVEPNNIKEIEDFNVISVANNHIMEHGEIAFLSTIDILLKNDIIPVGCKNKIQILEKNGFRIAIMAYSCVDDFILDCNYNKIKSEKKIIEEIRKIRNNCDLVILSLHWGCEYVPFPSPGQIKMGRKLIDCGADIILGHHAHVIQGYEFYKGKPIIYGLGNFVFDDVYIKRTRKSFIAKIVIDNDKNINVEIIPICCDTEYFPKIAEKKINREILDNISTIRKMIENKDISDYITIIGDYTNLNKKYRKEARIQMMSHFIKNIYRYPPDLIISFAKEYIVRKFK